MLKEKILLCIGVSFLLLSNLYAQSSIQIENAIIQIELDTSQTHTLPTTINANSMASVSFCVKVIAVFSDTANIDTVHIKVGRTLGGSQVANISIPYTNSYSLITTNQLIKNEKGFSVCVNPSVTNAYKLYLEIWADDRQGNSTTVYQSQIN